MASPTRTLVWQPTGAASCRTTRAGQTGVFRDDMLLTGGSQVTLAWSIIPHLRATSRDRVEGLVTVPVCSSMSFEWKHNCFGEFVPDGRETFPTHTKISHGCRVCFAKLPPYVAIVTPLLLDVLAPSPVRRSPRGWAPRVPDRLAKVFSSTSSRQSRTLYDMAHGSSACDTTITTHVVLIELGI